MDMTLHSKVPHPSPSSPKKLPESVKRLLSAAVMMPLAIMILIKGGYVALFSVGCLLLAAQREWYQLLRGKQQKGLYCLGFVYILAGFGSFSHIVITQSSAFTLWFCSVIWMADIGAYMTGKALGGPKLAPEISPNKTWAGLIGGVVIPLSTALPLASYAKVSSPLIVAIVILTASHSGDLLESWIKRRLGVKDSGRGIPGHGGILDRFDSLLAASIAAWLVLLLA